MSTSDITSVDELRQIYRQPGGPALKKEHASITDNDRAFLAHAPLVVISTADADGRCDASPKGGPPGFVRVLDDGSVAIPDLSGNNRLDSIQNLVANPRVALLFLLPGVEETLRVNGVARITTDDVVLDACTVNGARPKVAIVVDPDEVYIHCGKALRRSSLWEPAAWPDTTDMPTVACMLRDEVAPDVDAAVIEQALEDGYRKTLWEPGGQ
jgi:PPOX class probable FMN-dependent enzyme